MNAPQSLTEPEFTKLIAYLNLRLDTSKNDYLMQRTQLIIFLMLEAGLRIGEVAQLEVCDLLTATSDARILQLSGKITKTKQPRAIPVTALLHSKINRYLQSWNDLIPYCESSWAFGSFHPKIHLSIREIRRIVSTICSDALGRHVNPHMLRHTFATRLLRVSNTSVVQSLLGHAKLSSTQVYLHVTNQDCLDAIKKMV